MKRIIKKILYKPCRCIALIIQKYKDWEYMWGGRQRARYLKLVLAECGSYFTVNGKPIIFSPSQIHIGEHFTINDKCQIAPRGDIYIGDYVTMSRGAQITAGSLDSGYWKDEKYKERRHTQGDVVIGDGTWLCVNSIVLPGVKITGKGVIVAAGAVVTHDITENYVIVGGVPAEIVKRL